MNSVGYDNYAAPRNAIAENVARNVTMSSREIAGYSQVKHDMRVAGMWAVYQMGEAA